MHGKQYDVFISHAFEDKSSFSDALAEALKKKKLSVWYSGSELKIGDSIADNVNAALNSSVYGVVIISPAYLGKQWAMSELKALLAQETMRNRILPVLHGVTVNEARLHIPLLADRYAISSQKGIPLVVDRILEVVKGKGKYTRKITTDAPDSGKKENTGTANISPSSISNSGIMITGGSITVNGGQVAGGNIINDKKKEQHGTGSSE